VPIKIYKPTSPARRHTSVDTFADITKKRPERKLIKIKKRTGGRNASGKITVRHRGGGAKRFYRLIDYRRDRLDMPAKVVAIEYDPNRYARIALIEYADGVKSYILAPVDLKPGDEVMSSKQRIEIRSGNRMPLEQIPLGLQIYELELMPGKGAQIIRTAGSTAKFMALEGDYATIKLPSGEVRIVSKDCMATLGQVSNPDAMHIRIGKAGRNRHRGIKPTVRGKAMNPNDHPHGGGEGHNPIGMKAPKTVYGKLALGVPTRKQKKYSDKFILKRRPRRNAK